MATGSPCEHYLSAIAYLSTDGCFGSSGTLQWLKTC